MIPGDLGKRVEAKNKSVTPFVIFWVGVVGRSGTNTYPKKVQNFRLATSRETDL